MIEHMLALGEYRFSIDTAAYNELERISEYRWAEKAVIGDKPKLDYTGPSLETIELQGVIHPHYKGGLGQLDKMRQLASTGKPLQLMTGTGKDMANWVITKIHETQTQFYRKGVPLKQEFTISLKEYHG